MAKNEYRSGQMRHAGPRGPMGGPGRGAVEKSKDFKGTWGKIIHHLALHSAHHHHPV